MEENKERLFNESLSMTYESFLDYRLDNELKKIDEELESKIVKFKEEQKSLLEEEPADVKMIDADQKIAHVNKKRKEVDH